jgi:D-3-phosphoglycerate dehydrogenase
MSQPRRSSVSITGPALSTSPTSAISPPGASFRLANGFPAEGKHLAPFPVAPDAQEGDSKARILLLENVNASAVEMLKAQGFFVEEIKKALGEDELIKKLNEGKFTAVGIRSKTKVTAKVIAEVPSVRPLFLPSLPTSSPLFALLSIHRAPY